MQPVFPALKALLWYLLLFGELPDKKQLADFNELLGNYRCIPPNFVRDIIMKKPSRDIMNAVARSVLMLYAYDDKADDTSVPNVVRQSLQLISELPLLAVYSYQAYRHFHVGGSLIIHEPDPKLSTAENILHLLRADGNYTPLEAEILDIALVLHAEHGGGNNSTFTNHVVTSSGTDTYSTVVSSLASLKGPRHGGANIKVSQMFEDIKAHVKDWDNEEELTAYLDDILHKKAFDHTGLVYGVSANVDFYSGFVYSMLGLPQELFTPIFAVARISGWSAHRIEELINCGKIIRPAYRNVCDHKEYVPLDQR